MKFIITDIDQTITAAGIDLWHEITMQIIPVEKHNQYFEKLGIYKKNVALNPITESKNMMEYAVNLFTANISNNLFPIEIYTKTFLFVKQLLKNGGIRENAVEFMTQILKDNGQVVFSSANYIEGAAAVRDVLFEAIPEIKNNVKVSGSVVDWKNRSVIHINVAKNKIIGLEQTMQITKEQIQSLTPLIFGDDPVINDIELFKLNQKASFLMETLKNKGIEIPEYIKRTSWTEVFENIFDVK